MRTKAAQLREFLLLLLPFCLWCFFFRELILGQSSLVHDARHFYYVIKYYLDSMTQGVYPLWNPFQAWGKPDSLDARYFGEFNPFFLIIPLLNFFKVPYYAAYNMFFAGYWFLGCLGFYALARRLFCQELSAYAAYLLLLFSPLGPTVFSDPVMVLVFVPMVWLYFFAVAFHQQRDHRSLLGMAFCLMLLAVTYSTYHFLSVLLIVLVFSVMVYARDLPAVIQHWWEGLRRNTPTAALCMTGLLLSSLPGLFWCLDSRRTDIYAMDFVHKGYEKATGEYSLKAINLGNSATQADFDLLFSQTYHFRFKDPLFFYINVFMALVLLLSLTNRLDRRSFVWLAAAVTLFWVSLGSVTPVHQFLYDRIAFFQKFRNIYYFLPYAFPFLVLLTAQQLEVLLRRTAVSRRKWLWAAWIVGVHTGFYVYLKIIPDVMSSCLWTVVLSMGWWLWAVFEIPARRALLGIAAAVVLCVEPVQVFGALMDSHVAAQAVYTNQPQKIFFNYQRLNRDTDKGLEQQGVAYFKKEASDTSGFLGPNMHYLGMKWSQEINQNTAYEDFFEYVRWKFWVYGSVESLPDVQLADFTIWRNSSRSKALVEGGLDISQLGQLNGGLPAPVPGASGQFAVKHFDHNSISLKTDFKDARFLVYNDSYSPLWEAYVNGRKVPLYRANYAFKGIFLPAGPNQVVFRYRPLWFLALHYLVQAAFVVILIALAVTRKV